MSKRGGANVVHLLAMNNEFTLWQLIIMVELVIN